MEPRGIRTRVVIFSLCLSVKVGSCLSVCHDVCPVSIRMLESEWSLDRDVLNLLT